ncbi:Uu.00g129530.m01.CDS01 [Anthostomella pinea]|uniref:Uu.00g129530.m01.CDS01 n=1 Tax=Anthostomella pinea TaxID=933095 RepID=A0AAI8VJM8_9PEZI|nr:Uu.00g129530.m01.CDS01 [Anthostomella pinea]
MDVMSESQQMPADAFWDSVADDDNAHDFWGIVINNDNHGGLNAPSLVDVTPWDAIFTTMFTEVSEEESRDFFRSNKPTDHGLEHGRETTPASLTPAPVIIDLTDDPSFDNPRDETKVPQTYQKSEPLSQAPPTALAKQKEHPGRLSPQSISRKRPKLSSEVNVRASRVLVPLDSPESFWEYTWKRANDGQKGWVRELGGGKKEIVDRGCLLCFSDRLSIEIRANSDWLPIMLQWDEEEGVFQGLEPIDGKTLRVAPETMIDMLCGGAGEQNGARPSKHGYDKIQFCGNQAQRDGLVHFWVDTCCIDKSSSAELTKSINSMFKWYRNAARCYVYLDDVSKPTLQTGNESNDPLWGTGFRDSQWFHRGWTLQELLAPASVEFFSREGARLGTKRSLELPISDITGIPVKVLRGFPLPDCTVPERFAWAESRQTTEDEDQAYSLLGIFDVQMPLIYGEGKAKAVQRLREEINKASKGVQLKDFAVTFSLTGVPEIEDFVARKQELAQIREQLRSNGSRRTVVVNGFGGVGKTQLAIAYAKLYKDSYSAVFWMNIKDEDSLKQSFVRAARQILRDHPSAPRVSSIDTKDLDEVIASVKAWLSLPNNTRWLLIYDNYDNPKLPSNSDHAAVDVHEFLPEAHQGFIIITTRSTKVKIGHDIRVRKMEDVLDSIEILSNASNRKDLIHDTDTLSLVQVLDGLPLALATAGAYLDQTTTSFAEYLDLYKESWARLQKASPQLGSYEDRTLHSTWQLSFDHIQKQNEVSAKFLRLWGYFDNQDIWLELLQHDDVDNPSWLNQITKDRISFDSTVRVLSNYGLVEVHSSSDEQIESKGSSFAVLKKSIIMDELEVAYHNLGLLYSDQGKLNETEEMYQRALQGKEKLLGPNHISTLDTVNNLGNLYSDQDRLKEAEEMYQRALKGYKKALGPNHTSTLDTVHNLGNLYSDQGELKEAEKMYHRALQGKEQALGPDHTLTLDTVHNLANLYSDQGKLKKAEEMYQRALKGKEKALGPDHTSTLDTVHNLANLYSDQDKLKEAEEMYQRALRGFKKALGPDHTSTLGTINNLGLLYSNQDKLKEAEEMYQRALRGYEKVLGPNHTSTLDTVNHLGLLYSDQDKLEEAEKMYQRALPGFKKALGHDHTSTLNIVHNLGNLYSDRGELKEAEKMYQQALKGYEKAFGPDHTSTLNTVHNLGLLYKDRGELKEAEKMYQRALKGYEKALGPDHNSTLDTVNNLGNLYSDQGKLKEAEEMYQQALQGKMKALRPDHQKSIQAQHNRR